jgi:hypothetical protein
MPEPGSMAEILCAVISGSHNEEEGAWPARGDGREVPAELVASIRAAIGHGAAVAGVVVHKENASSWGIEASAQLGP